MDAELIVQAANELISKQKEVIELDDGLIKNLQSIVQCQKLLIDSLKEKIAKLEGQ